MQQAPSLFPAYVSPGDIATIQDGLFTFSARVVFDQDTRPEDSGFDPEDPDYGEENKRVCDAWRRDEWFYCGIEIYANYNGINIPGCLASLWGIEANFPGSDNSYLSEVVRELLPEAKVEAEHQRNVMRLLLAA